MKHELYNKKGQATGAVSAVIMLIVGVGVSVLVIIFVGTLSGQTYNLVEPNIESIGNNLVSGESIVVLNSTAVSAAHTTIQTGSLAVNNATNVVGLGNFSVDYTAGTLTLLNNAYNNTALTINYTWGETAIRASVQNSILSSFTALEQTGSYLPIVVLAVIIALVLTLVLSFTAFGGMNGSNRGAL